MSKTSRRATVTGKISSKIHASSRPISAWLSWRTQESVHFLKMLKKIMLIALKTEQILDDYLEARSQSVTEVRHQVPNDSRVTVNVVISSALISPHAAAHTHPSLRRLLRTTSSEACLGIEHICHGFFLFGTIGYSIRLRKLHYVWRTASECQTP